MRKFSGLSLVQIAATYAVLLLALVVVSAVGGCQLSVNGRVHGFGPGRAGSESPGGAGDAASTSSTSRSQTLSFPRSHVIERGHDATETLADVEALFRQNAAHLVAAHISADARRIPVPRGHECQIPEPNPVFHELWPRFRDEERGHSAWVPGLLIRHSQARYTFMTRDGGQYELGTHEIRPHGNETTRPLLHTALGRIGVDYYHRVEGVVSEDAYRAMLDASEAYNRCVDRVIDRFEPRFEAIEQMNIPDRAAEARADALERQEKQAVRAQCGGTYAQITRARTRATEEYRSARRRIDSALASVVP